MSKSLCISGLRGRLAAWLLAGALLAPTVAAAAAKPYVEEMPKRGFHLFVRPKEKAPETQWTRVQALDRSGKVRAAARQALALRIWWPNSPEAPQAQLFYARWLEGRRHYQEAFDAYQHLMDHYSGRFEFNEVLDRQMQIAKTLMALKKGHFLFIPGFAAPERAIPLFEKIVASAPEGGHAAEAFYLTGLANEQIYEYDKAIDAYFTALNRFPESEFAEKSAYAQAKCHIKVSDDSPNDSRALDTASAACTLFLQRFPDSGHRAEIEACHAQLREKQAASAYARARYYDRILRQPTAAIIEYRIFTALYPDAPQAHEARRRIAELAAPAAQEN
ncbi:MAG TPA: outer membrane protein assembly factor BamD [Kiritimatiellia bacterium]|nr:outer membrane protein assembly factor BamD [Kiritimatiellia bacterium]